MPKNVVCKKCNNLVNDWCEKVIDSPDPDMQRDCQHFCEKTHGVTVQEWVPVKERLPQEKVDCIVHYKHAYCDNDGYWAIGICFNDGEKFQINPAYKVTHWMPLPEPPKES